MSRITYLPVAVLIGAAGCQSTAPCQAFFREAHFSAQLGPTSGDGQSGVVALATDEYRTGPTLTESSLAVAQLQWQVTYAGLDPSTAVIHFHDVPGTSSAPILYSAVGFKSGTAAEASFILYQGAIPFDTLLARILTGSATFDVHAPGVAVPAAGGTLTTNGAPLSGTACIG